MTPLPPPVYAPCGGCRVTVEILALRTGARVPEVWCSAECRGRFAGDGYYGMGTANTGGRPANV